MMNVMLQRCLCYALHQGLFLPGDDGSEVHGARQVQMSSADSYQTFAPDEPSEF